MICTTASGDAQTSHTAHTERLMDKSKDEKIDATFLKEVTRPKEDIIQRNWEDHNEGRRDTDDSSRHTDSNSDDQQEIEAEVIPEESLPLENKPETNTEE